MEEKIYAFGMDGFIVPMMKRFAAEGALPHFERMQREGAVNQTLPSFPVWTPTNWATLSTGAHTGTHGVTRWRVEVAPGQRIDSFDGRANNAERIWNALERAGMKSVAVHYPAAHPSGVRSGYVVDGFGHPGHRSTEFEVASC
ncbi:MAG: alkaline phosphatase family protein [Gemmatimonadota bacterium]|nr:alkaline phosphatase family protein [Gemmatimonadota bacterium]